MDTDTKNDMIEQIVERLYSKLDEKLKEFKQDFIKEINKDFKEKIALVEASAEHANCRVDDLKKTLANFMAVTIDQMEKQNKRIDGLVKLVESLQAGTERHDLSDRSYNVVIYGVPNIKGFGMHPFQWFFSLNKFMTVWASNCCQMRSRIFGECLRTIQLEDRRLSPIRSRSTSRRRTTKQLFTMLT